MDLNNSIFFEGQTGWFRQVDLGLLGDTAALIPVEHDLQTLSFELLGDFVCSALTSSINRIWINRDRHASATLLIRAFESRLQVLAVFFDTNFADGTSLMTTATPALKDRTSPKYYRRVINWTNTYNLFEEHSKNISALSNKHGGTVPSPDSLLTVMMAMDKATAERG